MRGPSLEVVHEGALHYFAGPSKFVSPVLMADNPDALLNGTKRFLARHGRNDRFSGVSMLGVVDVRFVLSKDKLTGGKDSAGPYHQEQSEAQKAAVGEHNCAPIGHS